MKDRAAQLPGNNSECAKTARRIAFLTHVGDPGGAEITMISICRMLRESAEVLLFQHGSLEDLLVAERIRFSVCRMPASTGDVRKEGGYLSIVRAIPGSLLMIWRLSRKLKSFDVVVCVSQKSFVLTSLAKPFFRRPIFWFMNDILSPEHFSRVLTWLLVSISRFSADHIALVAQEPLNAWLKAGGRRHGVSVICSGVDMDAVNQQLGDAQHIKAYRRKYSPEGKPLIGMFGRICRWKGQHVFLKAIARLPHVQAVVVGAAFYGDESYERELRDLACKLGIAERVVFTGHIYDAMALMAACDVVAHCSTSPEPSGRVVIEAMFAGTPVIGSDAGGVPEFVTPNETGQLTPPNDHIGLAGAIQRYLDDPDWSRAVATRAKRVAEEKFSSKATVSGFTQVLESL